MKFNKEFASYPKHLQKYVLDMYTNPFVNQFK